MGRNDIEDVENFEEDAESRRKGWILHICPDCGKRWCPRNNTDEMRAMFSYCRECRRYRDLPDATMCRI